MNMEEEVPSVTPAMLPRQSVAGGTFIPKRVRSDVPDVDALELTCFIPQTQHVNLGPFTRK